MSKNKFSVEINNKLTLDIVFKPIQVRLVDDDTGEPVLHVKAISCQITPIVNGSEHSEEAALSKLTLYARSYCSLRDDYSSLVGKRHALSRAMVGLPKKMRIKVWGQFWKLHKKPSTATDTRSFQLYYK
jgi:hypothetical protein